MQKKDEKYSFVFVKQTTLMIHILSSKIKPFLLDKHPHRHTQTYTRNINYFVCKKVITFFNNKNEDCEMIQKEEEEEEEEVK